MKLSDGSWCKCDDITLNIDQDPKLGYVFFYEQITSETLHSQFRHTPADVVEDFNGINTRQQSEICKQKKECEQHFIVRKRAYPSLSHARNEISSLSKEIKFNAPLKRSDKPKKKITRKFTC